MRRIFVGNRGIGSGEPTFIVAEIGINHNGSREIAMKLIDVCAEAGADAVKLQKRNPYKMLTKEMFNSPYNNNGNSFGRTYGEHRLALELSEEDFVFLKNYAESKGLVFFASAWDEESADFLQSIGVELYKIGSPDLSTTPLCRHIARKNKPVILSTGMSEWDDIEKAVEAITEVNENLVLMHCVSIYPTPIDKVNLNMIPALQRYFGLPTGYSGHEMGIEVPIAAVAMGACVIEKHITLDRTMKGGDHKFSLEPDELKQMVKSIRNIEKAMEYYPKQILPEEARFRQKLAKSVVTRRAMKKGEILTEEDLDYKSPGNGVPPTLLQKLLGKPLLTDLTEESAIRLSDVGQL